MNLVPQVSVMLVVPAVVLFNGGLGGEDFKDAGHVAAGRVSPGLGASAGVIHVANVVEDCDVQSEKVPSSHRGLVCPELVGEGTHD